MAITVHTSEVKVLIEEDYGRQGDRSWKVVLKSLYVKPTGLDCNLHAAWELC